MVVGSDMTESERF